MQLLSFNSTTVRLKGWYVVFATQLPRCFNSTTVRLKERISIVKATFYSCFNSTTVRLKGFRVTKARKRTSMFQFYDSTIKSIFDFTLPVCHNGFNSTTVRLKVPAAARDAEKMFCFNSTTVRLKVRLQPDRCAKYRRFNSTTVRLKVGRRRRCRCSRMPFQFYDSTIKSTVNQIKAALSDWVSILRQYD